MKVAVLGAGSIARTMAETINGMPKEAGVELYAVGSRDISRAKEFAREYGVEKAYGSYEELVKYEQIDLVYIASPHSHHFEHMKLCVDNGKHVLCEKAFTVNAEEAKEILALAEEKGVLVTEAIWTRYMPSRKMICDMLNSGKIGKVHSIQANLGYELQSIERLVRPELAGGALLDVGVYPINFAMMIFGDDVEEIKSSAIMSEQGVDLMDSMTLRWEGNKMAVLHATMMVETDRRGVIFGEKGYLMIDNINNPKVLEVYNADHQLTEQCEVPEQISGYEYEVYACKKAIEEGKLQCEEMSHEQTISVMAVMDEIREQWGMKYPMEASR